MLKKAVKSLLIPLGLFYKLRQLKHGIALAWNHMTGDIYRSFRYLYSYLLFLLMSKDADRHNYKERKIISLLCPTRGRPMSARRLISSVYKTSAFPERVEILFCVDSDDNVKDEYLDFFRKVKVKYKRLRRVDFFSGAPGAFLKSWNILAQKSEGDLLVITNDDQLYVDYGWDVRLDEEVKRFPDEIFCMWFNDGSGVEDFCSFPIVSRRWVETVGYLSPDIYGYTGTDSWIMNIAYRIDRLRYIPDVLVDHLHVSLNKSPFDDTYQCRLDMDKVEKASGKSKPTFEGTESERAEAADRLRSIIEDYKKGRI